jgi:polysaccharide export outer membrane protein
MRLLILMVLGSCLGLVADEAADPPAREAPAGYRLYPGDLLHVQVYGHPDLDVQIRVPVDGVITFPLVGRIERILGMSEADFGRILQQALEKDFLTQAIVNIAVTELGPRRAYVMGAVEQPNYIELSPFAELTATQAIGHVGGFTGEADRASAQVIRDHGDGTKVSLAMPAKDEPGALQRDVVLQPGDIVIVPRLDRVFIIGRVRNPGAVNLPSQEKITVSKAISLAGGFDKFARRGEVQLLRAGQSAATVDVATILDGGTNIEDPVLHPGDTVFVPESRF